MCRAAHGRWRRRRRRRLLRVPPTFPGRFDLRASDGWRAETGELVGCGEAEGFITSGDGHLPTFFEEQAKYSVPRTGCGLQTISC